MDRVSIDLQNCYGIKLLNTTFDFSKERAFAIYAPNGVMKSSLAQVFLDVVAGVDSKDRIFSERPTIRNIQDENGKSIPPESVFVIRPYDEEFGPSEKTSSLLVDAPLRKEYEKLQKGIDRAKDDLLKRLKTQSGSKRDFERELAVVFTSSDPNFQIAMGRIKKEVLDQKDSPFADVPYDTIFDDKVLAFLGQGSCLSRDQQGCSDRNPALCRALQQTPSGLNLFQTRNIRLLQCRADRKKLSR